MKIPTRRVLFRSSLNIYNEDNSMSANQIKHARLCWHKYSRVRHFAAKDIYISCIVHKLAYAYFRHYFGYLKCSYCCTYAWIFQRRY